MGMRDWQIDFGPVTGNAGDVKVVTVQPQCAFRGEKAMATDTAGGLGTRIGTILVGQRLQRPVGGGSTLTAFLSPQALGNGFRWDTSEAALTIAVTVSFVMACTFDLTVFGKALVG